MADLPKKIVRTGYSHIAFSVGSIEIVDALTAELKADEAYIRYKNYTMKLVEKYL